MQMVKTQIQKAGLLGNTDFYYNGQEALDKAIKQIQLADSDCYNPIVLMLLDHQMPQKNGLELVQELRCFIQEWNKDRICKIQEPLIVFLTAYNNFNFKNHIKSKGIHHVFDKPLTES